MTEPSLAATPGRDQRVLPRETGRLGLGSREVVHRSGPGVARRARATPSHGADLHDDDRDVPVIGLHWGARLYVGQDTDCGT